MKSQSYCKDCWAIYIKKWRSLNKKEKPPKPELPSWDELLQQLSDTYNA